MRLYVVQHGEAVPKQQDPDRPLSEKGIADIECLADFLKGNDTGVHRIHHSGKTRALQTAETLARGIKLAGDIEECNLLNPSDPPAPFIQQTMERGEDILVVGHLPFVSRLVSALILGDEGRAVVDFQHGCAVCLETDVDGDWKVAWMIRPELLYSHDRTSRKSRREKD
jgi:phosphohistidine phosphatase